KSSLDTISLPKLIGLQRNLMLYRALNDKNKAFFRITDYASALPFIREFFCWWEAFNEEALSPDINWDMLYASTLPEDTVTWQQEIFQRLSEVREAYGKLLESHSDAIFSHKQSGTDFEVWNRFDRIVFVNQLYYSGLEKKILHGLCDADFEMIVYYQMPPDWLDECFNLNSEKMIYPASGYRLRKLRIITCSDELGMLNKLGAFLPEDGNAFIIDNGTDSHSYTSLLNPERFKLPGNETLADSLLFRYFQGLHCLASSFRWSRKNGIYPLKTVISILRDSFIASKYAGDDSLRLLKLTENLYIRKRIRWLDENLTLLKEFPGAQLLADDLKKLRHVKTIEEASTFLNNLPMEIPVPEALSDKWLKILAEVSRIEVLLNGISDCQSSGVGLIALVLDYLRQESVMFTDNQQGITVSTLVNSRNLCPETPLIILNVIEGVLPRSPSPMFLLTDTQRSTIGLSRYEDLRSREHYYFMRQVLNSEEVTILTIENIEKDIQPGSFIESLRQWAEVQEDVHLELVCPDGNQALYSAYFRQMLNPARNYQARLEHTHFVLPMDSTDFTNNKMKLSYSGYKILHKDPAEYYLRYIAGVEPLEEDDGETFNPLLVGDFIHELMRGTINRLNRVNSSSDTIEPLSFIPVSTIRDAINETINEMLNPRRVNSFFYKIPHRYTLYHFENEYIGAVKESVISFLEGIHARLKERTTDELFLLPEMENMSGSERKGKIIDVDNKIELILRGKADLMITTADKRLHWIVDYKTGNSRNYTRLESQLQLLFYEYLYYLLDDEGQLKEDTFERVHSFFYFIPEGTERRFSSKEGKYALKIKLKELIVKLFDAREWKASANNRGKDLPELYRFDLYDKGVDDE
ncbi:MAG: PD-(D/E)XK nuclease family protein, partial [Candidatus Cloacimonetes bacterium]|nr:PD-(D/E)XK nuclease family protein [Candidatus Cloacimonadota bacterium]